MLLSYVYVGIGVLAIFGFTLMQIGGWSYEEKYNYF
jgi:hypothetical protein